jgi:hypothetical protein
MNQKSVVILGIVALSFIWAVVYFTTLNKSSQTVPVQNGAQQLTVPDVNQQNNIQTSVTTETVTCGKNYVADVVMIDSVDVVKRIVNLTSTSNSPSKGKCEFNIAGNKIAVAQKADASQKIYRIVLYDKDDKQQTTDPFNQAVNIYQIDLSKNTVSFEDQFAGGLHELGSWK